MPLDLPQDIWLSIASFIEMDHLLPLAYVNRALYDIVLDARYRDIQWVNLDKKTLNVLRHLQDPDIARRVRCLHIRMWFIQYLFKSLLLPVDHRSQSSLSKWTSDGLSTASTHLSNLKESFTSFRAPSLPRSQVRYAQASQTPVCLQSPTHRLGVTSSSSWSLPDLMLNAFRRMVNLTEYKLEWCDLPVMIDTSAFLCRPDSNHLSSLRKLVLHAQLPQFHELLSGLTFRFSGLQELELSFEYNAPSTSGAPTAFDIRHTLTLNQTVLSQTIAPFISSLRSSLVTLSVSSFAECDHSCLFSTLNSDLFPRLRSLCVRIPFDTDHLSNTGGLVHFLQVHTGILHLELRTAGSGEVTPISKELGGWVNLVKECLCPSAFMAFANLESLTIPILDVREALELMQRSSVTLRKLCLLGRFLNEQELEEIINLFACRGGGQLKSLSIKTERLTPKLIDILAGGLPALWALSLVLESHGGVHTQLLQERGFRLHTSWGLYDLSIFLGRYREDGAQSVPECLEDSMTKHLLWSLPNVRSVKGRGSLYPDLMLSPPSAYD